MSKTYLLHKFETYRAASEDVRNIQTRLVYSYEAGDRHRFVVIYLRVGMTTETVSPPQYPLSPSLIYSYSSFNRGHLMFSIVREIGRALLEQLGA